MKTENIVTQIKNMHLYMDTIKIAVQKDLSIKNEQKVLNGFI